MSKTSKCCKKFKIEEFMKTTRRDCLNERKKKTKTKATATK